MLTPNHPSNKTSSNMFFPTCTRIIAMWGSMRIDSTLKSGAWRWIGWVLGNTLETTYFKNQGPNALIDQGWKYVYYLIIVNQFPKPCFVFQWLFHYQQNQFWFSMLQMTPALMVYSLWLFPLWISVLAFVGRLIRKSFPHIPPFPNLL